MNADKGIIFAKTYAFRAAFAALNKSQMRFIQQAFIIILKKTSKVNNGKIPVNQRLTEFTYGTYQTFAMQMWLGAQRKNSSNERSRKTT
jgi:hypothetical protein